MPVAKDLRKIVGQTLLCGFDGTEPLPELLSFLAEYNIGGVVLFKRNLENLEQAGELIQGLRDMLDPLLVAVDEEGGVVSRFRGILSDFPGAAALGRCAEKPGGMDLLGEVTTLLAEELRMLGLNWDLTPVLDVRRDGGSDFIAERTYSSDPKTVAALGTKVIEILQHLGVMACAKHFPGHGYTSTDSHQALPVLSHDLERLEELALLPFRAAIEVGVGSIMSAHLKFPALDNQFPSTMSPFFMSELLRRRLRYRGLVVSDDLGMGAIAHTYPLEVAAHQALKAGCDMLIISKERERQIAVFESLVHNVERGLLEESRLREANRAVQTAKKAFVRPHQYDGKALRKLLNAKATGKLLQRIDALATDEDQVTPP